MIYLRKPRTFGKTIIFSVNKSLTTDQLVNHYFDRTEVERQFRQMDYPGLPNRTVPLVQMANGEVVGAVHAANEKPGETSVQIHPDLTYLYPEMMGHAEEHQADRVDGVARIKPRQRRDSS